MDYSQVEPDASIAPSCVAGYPCAGPSWEAPEGIAPLHCLGGPPPFTGPGINIGSVNNPINIKAITIPPRKGKCLTAFFVGVDFFNCSSSWLCWISGVLFLSS